MKTYIVHCDKCNNVIDTIDSNYLHGMIDIDGFNNKGEVDFCCKKCFMEYIDKYFKPEMNVKNWKYIELLDCNKAVKYENDTTNVKKSRSKK